MVQKINFSERAEQEKAAIEAEQNKLTAQALLVEFKYDCVKSILATLEAVRKGAAEHGFSSDDYEREVIQLVCNAIDFTTSDDIVQSFGSRNAYTERAATAKRVRKPKKKPETSPPELIPTFSDSQFNNE